MKEDVGKDQTSDVAEGDDEGVGGTGDAELAELRDALDALNDRHLRLAAEFENFRRRSQAELGESGTRAQARLVGRIADVLDDLDRLASLNPEEATTESVIEGMVLVNRKLQRNLEEAGLEVIDPGGESFDPESMEAMLREAAESEEQDDVVSQVLQKGFRFQGHLVRPARVSVLKYD